MYGSNGLASGGASSLTNDDAPAEDQPLEADTRGVEQGVTTSHVAPAADEDPAPEAKPARPAFAATVSNAQPSELVAEPPALPSAPSNRQNIAFWAP